MPMIKCPECGNQISTRAVACIKCGLPLSKIFICPDCGKIDIREGLEACTSCGCPTSENEVEKQANIAKENSEQSKEKADLEYVRWAEKIISKVLARHSLIGTGIICDSGLPISDVRKLNATRVAFNIPKEEKIYFIVSGNIMSGINENCKGFAIASHGIYFRSNDKRVGMFYLHNIAELAIKTSFLSYLTIGSFEFNVAETKKIKNMLLDLQDEIRQHI